MSFISVIAQENFLTVMSEGRVSCGGAPAGKEDQKKIIRVNKNFIVTFGGMNLDLILKFINDPGLLKPNDGNFQTLAAEVEKKLQSEPYNRWKIFIGFGGINSAGLIEFLSLGAEGIQHRNHLLPEGDRIQYTFFHLPGYNMDLPKELLKFLGRTGYQTPTQTLKAQKLLNDKFSEINPTINRNTYQAVLQR